MDDLIVFLTARLDEDEAAAKAVAPLGHVYDMGGTRLDEAFSHGRVRYAPEDGRSRLDPDEAAGRHFALHDPARVLREVAAKRTILAEHAPGYPVTYPEPSGQPACGVCHAGGFDWEPENWPCPAVRAMAAVYSDHPDYNPGWKP